VNVSVRTLGCVRADGQGRPRGHVCVRVDASVLLPGNFIMDATVRPSHGQPNGHRPSVRPSTIVRLTTLGLVLALRCTSFNKILIFGLGVMPQKQNLCKLRVARVAKLFFF
jgi:hypothetical protein